MIKLKRVEVTKPEDVFEAMICDKCGKEFRDVMDTQEFHHIDFIGGYSSIFGDMNHIRCDLCQNCLKSLIDGIYRVEDVID